MKPPSPMELMQYVDGELSPGRARELAEWLAERPARDASAQVDGVRQVGDFVRARAEDASASFDVVGAVMARLDSPSPRRQSPQRRPLSSAWLSLGAAGLAAAAAVALVAHRPGTPSVSEPRAVAARSVPAETASVAPDVSEVEELGASIERLDPGSKGASLFVVQAGAVTTPVVWLLDDVDESGDRMGPL